MREGVESFDATRNDAEIEERIVPFARYRTELVRAVASGETPDIRCIDDPDTTSFASREALLDLSERIAASGDVSKDVCLPGPCSTVPWPGGIDGVPRDSDTTPSAATRTR